MPIWVIYLSAGAYIAIMLAVLGVPQLLSSYIDLRARRVERAENEANAERRHQENLAAEERREERRLEEQRLAEERRREEQRLAEDRRLEERAQEEERHREEQRLAEARRLEERAQEEERRRLETELWERRFEDSERRHQEMMAVLITAVNNGRNHENGQSQDELIRNLRQTVETLESENAKLRQQNGNGGNAPPAP